MNMSYNEFVLPNQTTSSKVYIAMDELGTRFKLCCQGTASYRFFGLESSSHLPFESSYASIPDAVSAALTDGFTVWELDDIEDILCGNLMTLRTYLISKQRNPRKIWCYSNWLFLMLDDHSKDIITSWSNWV